MTSPPTVRTATGDGYEALPIPKAIIEMARLLIEQIGIFAERESLMLPVISPAPNESIIFEWRTGQSHFALQILGKDLVYALLDPSGDIEDHKPFERSLPAAIKKLLRTFSV